MSDLPTEIQSDGGQLIENGEIAKEFPNGTIDSNEQVPFGKRREAGGNSTVQKRRQPTASKARDSKSEESIAVNYLLLLGLTHVCFPRARRHTWKLLNLSYYNQESGRYSIGWDDTFLVMHWIVMFTGLRVFVMEYIMSPLAEKGGIHKKKERIRFAEQAWIYVYYGLFWSLGMYIMYNSKYWLALEYTWKGWPDREMDGLFKWYYLVQFAFWLQQILVVNIEERRKDYAQMFTHHIVTCTLMFSSYGYHHHKIGNVILVTMDTVDTIFPLAKMLKYLKYQKACDIAFGIFMLLWVASRHIVYPLLVYSVYRDLPIYIQLGCYKGSNIDIEGPFPIPDGLGYLIEPFIDPKGLICQTEATQTIWLSLLIFLQAILLLWFSMIVRVAIKVLRNQEADDPRSDGEDEEEEETEELQMKDVRLKHEIYIEVPATKAGNSVAGPQRSNGKSSPSHKVRRDHGNASGVSLPHDRKELLGRIGCDKGN